MNEMPRFSDFRLDPIITDMAVDQLVKHRTKRYVDTGAKDGNKRQAVAVYTTMPNVTHPGGPIIRLPSWGEDHGSSMSAYFDAYVSASTGRPVISPNAPGVEWDEWADPGHVDRHHLTPDQLKDLAYGSFRQVGAATIGAAYGSACYDALNRDCIIHGASMGAALAGGAIHAIARGDVSLSVAGICLSEGTNYEHRSVVDFSKAFAAQRRTVAKYVAENPVHLQQQVEGRLDQVRRIRHSGVANAAFVKALSHGTFLSDVGSLAGIAGIPVLLDRGGGSRMSTAHANQHVVDELTEQDVPTTLKTYDAPHDHGYIHNPRSVIDAVRALENIT